MPTTAENDPIDGAELKSIILKRIGDQMDRDCTLTNDVAYAGFRLEYNIKLKYLRSKTADTLIWGDTVVGVFNASPSLGMELGGVELTDTYESDSPNTAREEHELPVPVMVQTPNGPEKRRIHVNRKTSSDSKAAS